MTLILALAIGYLLGAIPSGVLIARVAGLGDLRKVGSGNIGATNVLRTGNRAAAAGTLAADAVKGVAAVLLARWIGGETAAIWAGLAAVLGHVFPVWLRFRGGKGVATFLGVLLALAPLNGVIACLTWAAVARIWRISSLSALVAAVTAPFWMWAIGPLAAIPMGLILAVLIVFSHRENIQRLLAGTEPRIGQK